MPHRSRPRRRSAAAGSSWMALPRSVAAFYSHALAGAVQAGAVRVILISQIMAAF